MAQHSLLSPSNAHRWLECTPSALLESGMPQSESVYAAEGTLAHTMAAALVDSALGNITEQEFQTIDRECRLNEQWDDEIYEHAYTYRDYIIGGLVTGDTLFTAVEASKLSLEPYVAKAWGTTDFMAYDGAMLHIVDFKYGKGVAVSPDDNPQLKLYALGACLKFNIKPPRIALHIVQPRVSQPQVWETTGKELFEWAEKYVAPRAAMAVKGEGKYHPSSETCRFCKAKPICKGLAQDIFASVKEQPSLDTMTLDEAAAALTKASTIKLWINSLEEYLRDALMRNKPVKGWKLVEGRSSRKICDTAIAGERLRRAGFPDELTHKTSLIGITDLERLTGKKNLPDILGDVLIKPQGSPTLVEDADPRPAIMLNEAIINEFEKVLF